MHMYTLIEYNDVYSKTSVSLWQYRDEPAPCTCITKRNNKPVDNAEDIDIVMHMYTLIEYSDAYSRTSVSLWQ